ncbi:helix-turn-helix domain-containing protein [Microbacterium sp. SORGH_AS_0888]|uniref:AraC-like ligand-binding domain-containing protein n=1 Tax=Microbacterium sp. SORGH_AS_0888 TaxID=3041791 RepID=UPI00278875EC|nr:helix-turn-helix domain-containing protein [Microbacterium sp. SORGH_AS_0888]MDQ1131327.1 AraC-like DNA-binding protein [Microbacterium sp. SORGH_AS_0888]
MEPSHRAEILPGLIREQACAREEWQAIASRSFVPLLVDAPRAAPFHARLEGRVNDGVLFSTIRASGHSVTRSPELVAASSESYVKLTLQLSGAGLLAQDERTATLAPGDIVLYDTSRPYTLEFSEDIAAVVVMFPHRMINVDATILRGLTAVRIPGDQGFARAIGHFLAGLASALPSLDEATGLQVTHNTMDLIATMVGHELRDAPWSDPHAEILFRIDRYINAHLADPDLGPERIAAAAYISTRHLHTLFQRRGTTVSHWVRDRRLDHVRRDLRDPRRARDGVAAIAASWGFTDPSHFSKLFRAETGTSPSAYRAGD